jgi:hypothetical protein
MPVPNTFANATATIPLSQLDANFATAITLGNTAIQLGNTVSTLNNMTLANVTVSSGSVTNINITDVNVSNSAIISVNTSNNALRITQTGTGNALVVEDSANPDSTPFVIDASGNVIKGATSAFTSASVLTAGIQAQSTGVSASSLGLYSFNTTATQAGRIDMGRTRGALGAYDVVASGDQLGVIRFTGGDGSAMISAAEILALVDGTPGTNDMPGRLVFSTTADGASTPTERMRISSNGSINIATAGARITGDFSNATVANRVMFQTSTVNTASDVGVMPNGTATTASLSTFNASTPDNSAFLGISITSAEARIRAGIIGTGSYLPMTFYTGGSERMRVDTSGNVGIGTSSPAYRLDVRGNGDTSAVVISNFGSNGAALLRLFGSDTGAVYTPFNAVVSSDSNGAQQWYIGGDGFANTLVFKTGTPERMRIDSSGNVGIGTASPACALDVVGGIQTSRTAVTAPAAGDGNVFSGTYTPTLTNSAGISASTAYSCQYIRVGNTVTVSGVLEVTTTGTGSQTVGITLPIASNLSSISHCSGAGCFYSATFRGVSSAIYADVTNDRATLNFLSPSAASGQATTFTFTYRVI